MRSIIFLLLGSLILAACEKQADKDQKLILQYIEDNNLNAIEGEEGLYYVIEIEGSGLAPTTSNNVTVHYEGFLLNGKKFDSSIDRGQVFSFSLSQVIRGWQLGIPKLKPGGKGKLLIPSQLGYGNQSPSPAIPKNAVLIFDVELISVQ